MKQKKKSVVFDKGAVGEFLMKRNKETDEEYATRLNFVCSSLLFLRELYKKNDGICSYFKKVIDRSTELKQFCIREKIPFYISKDGCFKVQIGEDARLCDDSELFKKGLLSLANSTSETADCLRLSKGERKTFLKCCVDYLRKPMPEELLESYLKSENKFLEKVGRLFFYRDRLNVSSSEEFEFRCKHFLPFVSFVEEVVGFYKEHSFFSQADPSGILSSIFYHYKNFFKNNIFLLRE